MGIRGDHPSRKGRFALRPVALCAALCFGCGSAWSADFEVGSPDLKVRWDNTVKLSSVFRVTRQSSGLMTEPNQDDGNRNFSRGEVSRRVDLLSEFDMSYRKSLGARVSAALWYDPLYTGSNNNNSAATVNHTSAPSNEFTNETKRLHGRRADLLDAFVYASSDSGSIRLGRHALIYGETLFFGSNGIANAQAPVDFIKLLSVPGSQFKEIILPVNQLSGQYQLSSSVSVGGYAQFEWRKSRLPAVGSYLSDSDVLGPGAEQFLVPTPGGILGVPMQATRDARKWGQFGLQLRWRPSAIDAEFGFYAVKYHDKTPQFYLRPLGLLVSPVLPLNFQRVYGEDIKSYGASVSTVVGDVNVAAEASLRRNAPLVSGPVNDTTLDGSGGVGDKALYAVGNSAHLNISAVALFPASMLWDQSSLLAEIGFNRLLSVTRNPQALDPNATRDAYGLRAIFEPQYFQVLSGWDISVPLGLGYNPRGRSSVVAKFNGGVDKGGDVSLGLKSTYANVWKLALNYTRFIGSAGLGVGPDAHLTFKQSLADRDFVSLSVQRTF